MQLHEVGRQSVDDALQRVVVGVDAQRDDCRSSPGLAPESARGRPVDVARAFGEKHEPDHIRAGVERGVERQGRGKAANFDTWASSGASFGQSARAVKGKGGVGSGVGRLIVFRLNHAEVAFELVDFALRRGPHLGFRVAIKRDDPPPLVGQ